MTNKLLHPRKAHLIEHVTDDVRALHQNDVELQKTLLTGRALKDVLSGDSVDSSDEYDAKYFSDGKFDFNKMLDPSIRYIEGGTDTATYLHGPLEGTANEKFCGAMLHTFTVLPEGKLSYEGSTDGARDGAITSVRQVFYPDDPNDLDAYTRIGNWNEDLNAYEWSGWISLSGRLLRILVKDDSANPDKVPGILNHLLPYTIYELHCGGHEIRLPSADGLYLATSIAFEQYANTNYTFTEVNPLTSSPDPKQKYYSRTGDAVAGYVYIREGNNGIIDHFDRSKTYYTRDAITQWTNTVVYTEKVKEHASGVIKDANYMTALVPDIDTTRADAYDSGLEDGAVYEDSHAAVLYRFEVVNRETAIVIDADTTSSRTWLLDVHPEAIDALEGFAELLNAHTDMKTDDIIQYDKRGFKGGSREGFTTQQIEAFDVENRGGTLVIAHPANMRGVAKINVSLRDVPGASLSSNFRMSVYKFNENKGEFDPTGVELTFVESTDPSTGERSPNPYKKYYVYNEASGYVLADGTGHPGEFESGVTYYTRSFSPTGSMKVVACRTSRAFGTTPNEPYRAALFGAPGDEAEEVETSNGKRYLDVPRGKISSDQLTFFVDVARNDTIMVVIKSDNHDNDKKLFAPSIEIYPDPHDSYIPLLNVNDSAFTNRDLDKLSFPCNPRDSIPRTGALLDAYEMIAKSLQGKGLLYGRLSADSDLDDVLDPGIYTINSNAVANPNQFKDTGSSKHKSEGTNFENGTLIVYNTSRTCDDTVRRDDEVTPSESFQVTQVIFGCRTQETSAVSPVGEIWWRLRTPGGSWTPWARLGSTQSISKEYTTNVSKADVETLLAAGQAVVVVKGPDKRRVTLPNPKYHKGAKMQVEAINCEVDITYTDPNSSTTPITYSGTNVKDRMLYPLECDGSFWYVIIVS